MEISIHGLVTIPQGPEKKIPHSETNMLEKQETNLGFLVEIDESRQHWEE